MSDRGKRTLRRLVTVPSFLAAFALGLAVLPIALPISLAVDLLKRSRLARCRAFLFGVHYFGCEAAGIIASGTLWLLGRAGDEEAHYRLQRWWASSLLSGARVLFGFEMDVEGDDVVPEGDGPFLLLIRHVSVADTVLAAVYLSARHGHRLRYVLKSELLWDPCLDIVGNRLPNCFVVREPEKSGPEIERVRALAKDLGPSDGVLIYPEGSRFTPERRAAMLARFQESGRQELHERASKLQNVLLPRPGGTVALLEAAAGADVVLCAHHGFEGTMRMTDLTSGALVGTRVQVRFQRYRGDIIPGDPAGKADWLYARWCEIDSWVGARSGGAHSRGNFGGE